MYRQVHVHPDDWDLQRILWIDEQGNSTAFQLTTVTYGTKSAPFLALRSVSQLVTDEGHKYPRATVSLIKGWYVDDIYGGSNNFEELNNTFHEVKHLCMAGEFPLAKWQSNHPQFLARFSPESSKSDSIIIDEGSTNLLGLSWYTRLDVFRFNHRSTHSGSKPTKKIILSKVAQLFAVLGCLTPFTVRPKMLMQELWLTKLNWDEPVPIHFAAKWTKLKEELKNVSIISIPR